MKKIYLSLLVSLGLASSVCGQRFAPGLKLGGSAAYGVGNVQESKLRLGYQGGATLTIQLLDSLLFLQSELLYSVKGDEAITYTPLNIRAVPTAPFPELPERDDYIYIRSIGAQLRYLDFPLLLRANVLGLYVEAGAQLGYLLSYQSNDITVELRNRISVADPADPTATVLIDSPTATYRKLDYGYAVGFGYQDPKGLSVGWRYNRGLRDIYEPIVANGEFLQPRVRNLSIQFYLGYQFTRLFR